MRVNCECADVLLLSCGDFSTRLEVFLITEKSRRAGCRGTIGPALLGYTEGLEGYNPLQA